MQHTHNTTQYHTMPYIIMISLCSPLLHLFHTDTTEHNNTLRNTKTQQSVQSSSGYHLAGGPVCTHATATSFSYLRLATLCDFSPLCVFKCLHKCHCHFIFLLCLTSLFDFSPVCVFQCMHTCHCHFLFLLRLATLCSTVCFPMCGTCHCHFVFLLRLCFFEIVTSELTRNCNLQKVDTAYGYWTSLLISL